MAETIVVNLRYEPYDVYIGRAGHGLDGYFGNPFRGSRTDSIAAFRQYFIDRLKTDAEFNRRVRQLKGKRLGCFCKPKKCHGDIIAAWLDELPEETPVTLAIVGSRTFNDYAYLCSILEWYTIRSIVSGGAKGADSLAKRYANEHNLTILEFIPDWNKLGKSAGYKRNEQIVNACDEVIAFWDGQSKGTAHTIKIAQDRGIPVSVYWPQKQVTATFPEDEISVL